MVDVFVDGAHVASERDLHSVLDSALDFGPCYGWNLAALRDRLLNDVSRPVRLVWKNSSTSAVRLGDDLFVRIVRILEAAAEQDRNFGWDERFKYALE